MPTTSTVVIAGTADAASAQVVALAVTCAGAAVVTGSTGVCHAERRVGLPAPGRTHRRRHEAHARAAFIRRTVACQPDGSPSGPPGWLITSRQPVGELARSAQHHVEHERGLPCLCSRARLYLNVCIGLRIAGEKIFHRNVRVMGCIVAGSRVRVIDAVRAAPGQAGRRSDLCPVCPAPGQLLAGRYA